MDIARPLLLPKDLLTDAQSFEAFLRAGNLTIEVSPTYLNNPFDSDSYPEVIAIQRLLSLARSGIQMNVRWHKNVADQVFKSPSLFPLLSVVLCLDNVNHDLIQENGAVVSVDVQSSRQEIYKYRLQADLFTDNQVIICADSRGHGRPKSLYSSTSSGLIAREDFESLVDRLLAGQTALDVSASQAVEFSQNIATIIAELFENTDMHGRIGLDGVPFKENGIRGIIFKRVTVKQKKRRTLISVVSSTRGDTSSAESKGETSIPAFEISVFDSGVGFYSSFTRQKLDATTPLPEEWKIMHRCLERHYDTVVPDTRSPHRGMGLYEVLRALKFIKGFLEVRSGRAYGYRTFMEGETQFQLESRESSARPGMPKPVLLDVANRFVTVPSPHEVLSGASVRVLIPLR